MNFVVIIGYGAASLKIGCRKKKPIDKTTSNPSIRLL